MEKVKTILSWLLAFAIAFCAVNLLCFLYERPTGWFDTPNGPSHAGWRPNSLIVHGMEGYGITKVDQNGYLNPAGILADTYILMMGSSHTQGKEVPSNQKYSVLVNDHFADDKGRLRTYNISSDGNFLPSLIKHFPAAVEAFPNAYAVTLEIGSTDFSEEELEKALNQVSYDPQNTIVKQVESLSAVGKLKNGVKECCPLLSLMKKKLDTNQANKAETLSDERDTAYYAVLLERAMSQIRKQFDGDIVFIYHPTLIFGEYGAVDIAYSETWELFQKACRENGIDVIDMGPVFFEHYEKTSQLPYGFSNTTPGAGHLNRVGHRLIAQSVVDFLEETA